jgi:amino acid transporter
VVVRSLSSSYYFFHEKRFAERDGMSNTDTDVVSQDHVLQKQSSLRAGRLGFFDVLAQSVGLLALEMGVALSISFVAASAGAAAPLAYAIAGLGSLCLAYVFNRFAQKIAHAGSLYAYISEGLGSGTGFLGGWMYGGAFAVGVSFTLAITSLFLANVFEHTFGFRLHWFLLFVILLIALGACAFFGVRLSTRIELVLSAIGAACVLLIAVLILARGGANGLSLTPFIPTAVSGGPSVLLFAAIFGFTSFIGFESATVLGEETHHARRVIPSAVFLALLIGLFFYVFLSYSLVMGYGGAHVNQLAQDQAPLDTMATHYGSPLLASIVDLVVAISAFTASLAGLNLASRMLFAMGRDQSLPTIFSRTHPRYKTPSIAIGAVLLITLLLGATLGLMMGPFLFYGFLATTASLLILVAYILVALSWGVIRFRGRRLEIEHHNFGLMLADVLCPLVAIIICAATIYSSILPVPPPPLTYAPYIAGIWLLLGGGFLAVHWWQDPERVRRFGKATHLDE